MNPSAKTRLVPVQVLLLALCALSLSGFVAWVVSYNGLGLVDGDQIPSGWGFVNAVMYEPVDVQGAPGVATAAASNEVIGPLEQYNDVSPYGAPHGASEFFGNEAQLSFWNPTWTENAAWTAVRAVPLAGLALIWWLLFTIVRRVRRDEGFSTQVANRLRAVGLLILIGAPLCIVARWGVATWLVEGSTASKIADATPLSLPYWPFALGVVVLVISGAWRQAATMREDLEGLV